MIKISFTEPKPTTIPASSLKPGDTFILDGLNTVFLVTDETIPKVVRSVSLDGGFRHIISDLNQPVTPVQVEANISVDGAHGQLKLAELELRRTIVSVKERPLYQAAPRGERVEEK